MAAKKNLSKRKRRRRLIKRTILFVLLIFVLGGLIYAAPKLALIYKLSKEAKQIAAKSSINTFKETKTTIIYDSKGNELCTMRDAKDLYYVEFDEIPVSLANAFVVMEDRDFYNHRGIDYKAIARAVIENQKSNAIVQGASTITQQLARNIFLNQDVNWERKIEEMFLARELEKKYSKEQILEFYLNNIYFGNGYYGVEAASRGYFNKAVNELTLSEQVFIAAIPNNPTRYNPWTNYENTLARRDLILGEMYEADYINTMNYYTALEEPVEVAKKSVATRNNSVETYARHCATESLMMATGFVMLNNFKSEEEYETYLDLYEKNYTVCQQMLLSGGYSIFTSIDMNAQNALQDAIDNNLSEFSELSSEGIYKLQSAATSIDNETGNVVAIVGSRSQELEGYTLNRAYQSYRQPGSSIKPIIVYLPFLQKGNTPETVVVDENLPNGPNNADGVFAGPMTLRTAVEQSKNTVAWKLYQDITPVIGSAFLINQGFEKVWMDREYNAASLGGFTYGVSTEEMAGAYATIANEGEYRYTTCIVRIDDANGYPVVDTSDRGIRIYDINSCKMMSDMLKSAVEEGTGAGAKPDNAIVAGKTGTTNSNKDAWFCGYSRYYTTAIWIGYDYPQTLSGVNARLIFKDYMEVIHKNLKEWDFDDYPGKPSERPTEPETEEETTEETESESETETVDPDIIVDPDTVQTTTPVEMTKPEIETTIHGGDIEVPTIVDIVIPGLSGDY